MQRNRDPERANQLKGDGNKRFQTGDYVGAESLYSKAIIADDANSVLYTNRAMARLKLQLWDSVVSDCQTCLKLNNESMKANFYLSKAHLQLHNHEDALFTAIRAHTLCVVQNDKSLAEVTTLVLQCKKDKWEDMERKRKREGHHLESEMLTLLERERDEQTSMYDSDDLRQEVQKEWDWKITLLQRTFETARKNEEKKREVPDWAIDDISFGIMVDPVITKTGKSYERASILEHLRRQPTDPLTREPLLPHELRPNLGLKEACDEFLQHNGWAVDW
ncbi:U-box domain-containing protein [Xylariales sp. AK1849]|nr:U-box domain-containing protein [Xylariales sp. AK1849]